jgi:hypothetical protein
VWEGIMKLQIAQPRAKRRVWYVDHNPWLAKKLCTLVLRNNFPKINVAVITWFSVTMDTLKQLKH